MFRKKYRWIWIITGIGLTAGACVLLGLIVLRPTALVISAVDAGTGQPLPGAIVTLRPRGAQPLPAVLTGETGKVRFENLAADPAYDIRVQKADYALTDTGPVSVTERQATLVTIPLLPRTGERLFVGLEQNQVAEVDLASLLVVRTIHLPAGEERPVHHLLLHPTAELLYVIAGSQGYTLDSRTTRLISRLELPTASDPFDQVEGWCLSEDGRQLLVMSYQPTVQVMILDAHTGALLASERMRSTNPGMEYAVLYRTHGSRMLAVRLDEGLKGVDTIDAVIPEILDGLPAMLAYQAVMSTDGRYLYYWSGPAYFGGTDRLHDELRYRKADIRPSQTFTWTLPAGTSAVEVSPLPDDPDGYVLNATLGTLTIVEPAQDTPPLVIPVGKEPETLAVSEDGIWAYVANRASSTLTVIHLPSASVAHTIPLPGNPLSLVLR